MEKVKELITRLDLRKRLLWLVYVGISLIMWAVRPYFMQSQVVRAFYVRDGEAAYIYNAVKNIWSGSRFIGSSMTNEQIISYLPEYNITCLPTNMAARCGILVSVFICILIVALIILCIVLCRKYKTFVNIVISCILVQILMFAVVLILQNWLLMPFVMYIH